MEQKDVSCDIEVGAGNGVGANRQRGDPDRTGNSRAKPDEPMRDHGTIP